MLVRCPPLYESYSSDPAAAALPAGEVVRIPARFSKDHTKEISPTHAEVFSQRQRACGRLVSWGKQMELFVTREILSSPGLTLYGS